MVPQEHLFAKDSDGNIININDVTEKDRAKHFFCIGCDNEMRPVIKGKKQHHFRHKAIVICNHETYLHRLGKGFIKWMFNNHDSFPISYYVNYFCDKTTNCKFADFINSCNRREPYSVDLKKYYDTCEEEVSYRGFRADLMLSSSEHPDHRPIFIEISVSHDCEPEKINSGIRIIEIKLQSEYDVFRSLNEENLFIDTTQEIDTKHPYKADLLPSLRFYNFKRRIQSSHNLDRFWISKGDNNILYGNITRQITDCQNIDNTYNFIYDLLLPANTIPNDCELLDLGTYLAHKKGIQIKQCRFCELYNYCTFKIKDKSYPIWKLPIQKLFEQAPSCRNFLPYKKYSFYLFKKYNKLPYLEMKEEE